MSCWILTVIIKGTLKCPHRYSHRLSLPKGVHNMLSSSGFSLSFGILLQTKTRDSSSKGILSLSSVSVSGRMQKKVKTSKQTRMKLDDRRLIKNKTSKKSCSFRSLNFYFIKRFYLIMWCYS